MLDRDRSEFCLSSHRYESMTIRFHSERLTVSQRNRHQEIRLVFLVWTDVDPRDILQRHFSTDVALAINQKSFIVATLNESAELRIFHQKLLTIQETDDNLM